MEAARWERLETLLEQAMARPAPERASFVDEICEEEPELGAELSRLLAVADQAPAYFQRLKGTRRRVKDEPEPVSNDLIGRSVSHYQVLGPLGGGGMGVVYRAEDTRLRRIVALKFLPPECSRDALLKRRLMREAQAASSLDHPNICTVYEVDETRDGRLFIVMACYEGASLAEHITERSVSVEEAVDITSQIAEGLQAAHRKGVIHRDLKPGNVMLTTEGVAKIVDFGLAKVVGESRLTTEGVAIGTAAYMAPEQARGDEVDHRADIWALGVMLYEMATGERPFRGAYEQAVLYGVLNVEPTPPSILIPAAPAGLTEIIRKCLQKDPSNRYSSVADVSADLRQVAEGRWSGTSRATRRLPSPRALTVGAALLSIAVVLAIFVIPTTRFVAFDLMGVTRMPDVKHVAILPFEPLSPDSESRIFCDGLVELVISQLGQLEGPDNPSFWVVPASEVRRYELTSAEEARRIFGVNLAVTGSYQQIGDRVRITASLVDARTLRVIDSDVIDVPAADRLSLQTGVADRLVVMLQTELAPEIREAITAGGTTNSASFDDYVRGMAYLQRHDRESNVDEAIRLLRRAAERDTTYARAHAALCEAYWRKYHDHSREPTWADMALASCRRAVAADDRLPEAHVNAALVYIDTGELANAEDELNRAEALDPSDAAVHRTRARLRREQGRLDEAEEAYKSSIELRPDYWLGYNALGIFYLQQGRYEEAAEAFRQITRWAPDNFWGHNHLGAAHFYLGRVDSARIMWERALEIRADYRAYSNLASIYYTEGRYADAARTYEKALDMDPRDYRVWGNLAKAYYWAPGERHRADSTFRRAAALAEEALSVNPMDNMARSILATYLVRIDSPGRAKALIEDALTAAEQDVQIMVRAADVYLQLGRHETALNWLERALAAGYSAATIRDDPSFAVLRDEQRFKVLVDSVAAVR